MTDLKRGEQQGGGRTAGTTGADGSTGEQQHGKAGSSKAEGTNRDFDQSDTSVNQGHGHPREERGSNG
jgi:hypothetical protein